MGLLDNLPHRCTIRRRSRARGPLAGSKDSFIDEQTNVACWEQQLSARDLTEYQKQGIRATRKVYFAADPHVTERHQIVVTERQGQAVADPVPLDVVAPAAPDASAGLGVLYRVAATESTGRDD